jgi:hypothetical protein
VSIFDKAYAQYLIEWMNNRATDTTHLYNARLGGSEKDGTANSQEHSESAKN